MSNLTNPRPRYDHDHHDRDATGIPANRPIAPQSCQFNSLDGTDPRKEVTMPLIRPTIALRASRALTLQTPRVARPFSTTLRRTGGDHHGSPYEPPTGWLWGVKPGEKVEKEGWEFGMLYVFIPSCILLAVALAFKPDTSLDTWALEEARRRLEAEGIIPDPHPEHVLPVDEYTSTREGRHPPV
ncbi:uncharacterized protein DNG_07726 [Cephalotrichum gorgonifer]|uniref:NADH dehydrogenase [ubiquinone] 1 beta subcomplex subunit 11, mitochondrial n=1 Tax=Cephalotrichum gorgonifer TaxID=2041049 RepID=A0AAE8SXP2_9PEZI|nr:uncharacterized protein DNG_07726 [Cephalotrichum gorgonifer]